MLCIILFVGVVNCVQIPLIVLCVDTKVQQDDYLKYLSLCCDFCFFQSQAKFVRLQQFSGLLYIVNFKFALLFHVIVLKEWATVS